MLPALRRGGFGFCSAGGSAELPARFCWQPVWAEGFRWLQAGLWWRLSACWTACSPGFGAHSPRFGLPPTCFLQQTLAAGFDLWTLRDPSSFVAGFGSGASLKWSRINSKLNSWDGNEKTEQQRHSRGARERDTNTLRFHSHAGPQHNRPGHEPLASRHLGTGFCFLSVQVAREDWTNQSQSAQMVTLQNYWSRSGTNVLIANSKPVGPVCLQRHRAANERKRPSSSRRQSGRRPWILTVCRLFWACLFTKTKIKRHFLKCCQISSAYELIWPAVSKDSFKGKVLQI